MTAEEMPNATRGEQIAAALGTLVLTVLCVLLHLPIIFFVLTRKNFKSSFFKICAGRSIGHIIAAVTTGLPCGIALLWNQPFLIYFINGYYYALNFLLMTELLIALNRFIAVFFWISSASLFRERNTLICITVLVLITIGRAFWSVHNECYAVFHYDKITMEFDDVKCQGEVIILMVMESLMFGGFVLNLITLRKLVLLHRRGVGQDNLARNRLRQNVTHFKFTFAQSVIWMVIGWSIIGRSEVFKNQPFVHFVIEDLVEFMGSVAEGCLFWWLHGNHVFNRHPFLSGNSGLPHSNSRVVIIKPESIPTRPVSSK